MNNWIRLHIRHLEYSRIRALLDAHEARTKYRKTRKALDRLDWKDRIRWAWKMRRQIREYKVILAGKGVAA